MRRASVISAGDKENPRGNIVPWGRKGEPAWDKTAAIRGGTSVCPDKIFILNYIPENGKRPCRYRKNFLSGSVMVYFGVFR